jgi:FAD synthetase
MQRIVMKKVLAGGAFNLIHPGHILFLRKARELGDFLVVVVASDKTVLRNKGYLLMPAEARKKVLEGLRMVDNVVIGDEKDFFKAVEREKPDIIALGYDQALEKKLRERIERSGIRISRIKESDIKYKTEKIVENIKSA